jgi:hypothetical protein
MTQGVHERRNYPPPRGIVIRNQAVNRHHTTQGQTWNQDLILCGGPAARHASEDCQPSLGGMRIQGSRLHERPPRGVTSGSNHVVLKASFRSNRS